MTTTPSLINGSSLNARQKRVMPSRSRRGGPGIGSTEVDLMILDTQRRKLENEPLIPADSKFLLTTNTSFIPSTSSTSAPFELNSHAYERYFDRPDVLESYKSQLTIQTPEFSSLTEEASVGGRFRPRIHEDEITDTSDAAYEKRHRKYETFEKRQRLREKEKLKHEQYKLKERIEQLRGMESSAFLALPASSFSPIPGSVPDNSSTSNEADADDVPGPHANGTISSHEGERRRQEMLDVAMGLEERYRVLLPPDRRYIERSGRLKHTVAQAIEDPDTELVDGEDETVAEMEPEEMAIDASNKQSDRLRLKLKLPSREQSTATPLKSTSVVLSAPAPSRKKRTTASPTVTKNQLGYRSQSRALAHSPSMAAHLNTFPVEPVAIPIASPPPSEHSVPDASDPAIVDTPSVADPKFQRKTSKQGSEPVSRSRPNKRRKEVVEPEPADVEMAAPDEPVNDVPLEVPASTTAIPNHVSFQDSIPLESESISTLPIYPRNRPAVNRAQSRAGSRARSRARSQPRSSPKPPVPTNLERNSCLLMVSAMRTSNAPLSRKTQRHVTAFGVKVPDALEDIREFMLPRFIKPLEGEEEAEHHGRSESQVGGGDASVEPELEDDEPELEDEKDDGDGEPTQLLNASAQNSEELAASALLQL